jgi:tRNA pseudouridine38-40 synthase
MVLNRPVRSPLERRYAHWVREPLAVSAMQAAADLLVGEHDFASFGQPMRPEESTVRAVYSAAWTAAGADLWAFDVVGNAFLRGMVRSLVGALLQVGVGRWPVAQVSETLAARNRALAAPPAPACGLCLLRVDYD